jgi:hypothetical protein
MIRDRDRRDESERERRLHATVLSAAFAPPANQFVIPGAIPWLRLQVVGTQSGPTGAERLTATTFIQRLERMGGIAPAATGQCRGGRR